MSFIVVQKIKPQEHKKQRRLVIVVGKEIIKKAVKRNLIKRRLRAVFKPLINKSFNCYKVFVKKPEISDTSFNDLTKEITTQINR